jgi:hypothetical protein
MQYLIQPVTAKTTQLLFAKTSTTFATTTPRRRFGVATRRRYKGHSAGAGKIKRRGFLKAFDTVVKTKEEKPPVVVEQEGLWTPVILIGFVPLALLAILTLFRSDLRQQVSDGGTRIVHSSQSNSNDESERAT